MTIQNLYKQFEAWGIKWKTNNTFDEFFIARVRLTCYYTLTAVIILGGSSFALYNTILSNFSQTILEEGVLNPLVARELIDRAQDILINRFVTIDAIIIFFIIILGFLVTQKTLKPIRDNMEKQKRFIADASHELRTPIAVIISGLEVNLSNKKLDLASAKKILEDTLCEMQDFSKLSNNLLDISKADTKKQVVHTPLVIEDIVREIVEKSRYIAQSKQITINSDLPLHTLIQGNQIELERVFYNIIDNAIKYTPMGGSIQITEKVNPHTYTLTVSDTGVGIERGMLSKIFDPFFRANTSRNTSGAGLGLTLVKKVLDEHKGTITIKSDVGKGTIVDISLPISTS